MSADCTYRCLECLDNTVTREFDVSHLSLMCQACDTFGRFVSEAVYVQFQTFEKSPPDTLDWERLDRLEKLVVCERVVRTDHTIEDFEIEE